MKVTNPPKPKPNTTKVKIHEGKTPRSPRPLPPPKNKQGVNSALC